MRTIWQDLRYAVRVLCKNPGFTAVAVILLGIGTGVNSTAFSLLDTLLLRSFPFKEPGRIAQLSVMRQGRDQTFSYLEYLDICERNRSFSGIIASARKGAELRHDGLVEIVRADLVTENYFSVLGIEPALGQEFTTAANPEAPSVVISHSLWQRHFASDPTIVGKPITVGRRSAVIAGVTPPSFGGLQKGVLITEIWLPARTWLGSKALQDRQSRGFDVLLGRLNPEIGIADANAELQLIARRLSQAHPAENSGVSYTASMMEPGLPHALTKAAIFLAGPILVLVICCINVSTMLLSQAEGRQNEIAVRLALGSGNRRLVRQLLTENLMLAAVGTGLGTLMTFWLIDLLPALMPPMPLETRLDVRMDVRVAIFSLATMGATVLFSGVAPAFHALKTQLTPSLKDKSPGMAGQQTRFALRDTLVTAQIAISLALVIVTGFFLKTMMLSEQINPGFDTDKQMLIIGAVSSIKPEQRNEGFVLPVLREVKSIAGVKEATYAGYMLLSGTGDGRSCETQIPGRQIPDGQKGFVIRCNSVGRDYFETMGTVITRGRAFDKGDEAIDQHTVIINERMAEQFWPGGNPVGMYLNAYGRDFQIIGVAETNRISHINDAPEPYIYFNYAQVPVGDGVIIIDIHGDPLAIAAQAVLRIQKIDSLAIIAKPRTLDQLMSGELYSSRINALLSAGLGLLGLILAAIGLYAVVGYFANQRRHEIGIRMALGARLQDVSRMIIAGGIRLSLTGVGAGLVLSFIVVQVIENRLFGLAPIDVWIFVAGAAFVFAVSLLAGYLPARNAAHIDPSLALRTE